MVEYAPFPAQHYCMREKRSLQDSAPGLPAVHLAESLVMKAMHINKPMICSLAATCSCGCHCLWLLQLVLVVRDVGLHALLVHQLSPGLKTLAAGTGGGFEAGFVVAGFAVCEGEHG